MIASDVLTAAKWVAVIAFFAAPTASNIASASRWSASIGPQRLVLSRPAGADAGSTARTDLSRVHRAGRLIDRDRTRTTGHTSPADGRARG